LYKTAGKPTPFGFEGGWFYVNSAHNVSRSWVEDYFPEANARGAVPVELVARELGCDQIDILIIGGVARRRYTEDKLLEITAKRYSSVQANKIAAELTFCNWWRGLPVLFTNSVDAYLGTYVENAKKAHAQALENARAVRNRERAS
jgi:hypothetical protein